MAKWMKFNGIILACLFGILSCGSTPPSKQYSLNQSDYKNIYSSSAPFLGLDYRLFESISAAFPERYEKRYWSMHKSPDGRDGSAAKLNELNALYDGLRLRVCQYRHQNDRQHISVFFELPNSQVQLRIPEIYDIDPSHPFLFIGPKTNRCPPDLAAARQRVLDNISPAAIASKPRFLSESQELTIKKLVNTSKSRTNDDRTVLASDNFVLNTLNRYSCGAHADIEVRANNMHDFFSRKDELTLLLISLPAALQYICQSTNLRTILLDGFVDNEPRFTRFYSANMGLSDNWKLHTRYVFEKQEEQNLFACGATKPVSMSPDQKAFWEIQAILGVKLQLGFTSHSWLENGLEPLARIEDVCADTAIPSSVNVGMYIFLALTNQHQQVKVANSTMDDVVQTFLPLLDEREIIKSNGHYKLLVASKLRLSNTTKRSVQHGSKYKNITLKVNKNLAEKLYKERLTAFNSKRLALSKRIKEVSTTFKHKNTTQPHKTEYDGSKEPLSLRASLTKLHPFGGTPLSRESFVNKTFVSGGKTYTLDDLVVAYNTKLIKIAKRYGLFDTDNYAELFSTDDGKYYLSFISTPDHRVKHYTPREFIVSELSVEQIDLINEFGSAKEYFGQFPTDDYFNSHRSDGYHYNGGYDFIHRVLPVTQYDSDVTLPEMSPVPLSELMTELDYEYFYSNIADVRDDHFEQLIQLPSLSDIPSKRRIQAFKPTELFMSTKEYQTEIFQWLTFGAAQNFAKINGLVFKQPAFWDGFNSSDFYNLKGVFEGDFSESTFMSPSLLNLIAAYYTAKYSQCPNSFEQPPNKYDIKQYFLSADGAGNRSSSLVDQKTIFVDSSYFPMFEQYRQMKEADAEPNTAEVLSTVLQLAQGNLGAIDAAESAIREYKSMENDALRFVSLEGCDSDSLRQYERHLSLRFNGDAL